MKESSLESLDLSKESDQRSNFRLMGFVAVPLMLFVSGLISMPFLAGGEIPFIVALLSVVISEIVVVIIAWKTMKLPFKKLFKVYPPKVKGVFAAILTGVGLMVGLQLVSFLISLLGGSVGSSDTSVMLLEESGWLKILTVAIITPIIIPIAEEFVFRGVVYNFLEQGLKKNKVFWATAVSAVLFGASHFQGLTATGILVLVWTTLFGVLAAFLYRKFESIWVPIIAHGVYNGVNSILIFIIGGL